MPLSKISYPYVDSLRITNANIESLFTNAQTFASPFIVQSNSPTATALIARGNSSSSTANLQEWQNSNGTIFAQVNLFGGFFTNDVVSVGGINTSGIAQLLVNSQSATRIAEIVRGHPAQTSSLQEWQDSAGSVQSAVGSDGTFQIKNIRNVGGTVNRAVFSDVSSSLIVNAANTNYIGLSVRRFNDSQTSDLQQWTNSSGGTVYARIEPSGNFTTVGTVSINTTGTGTLNLGDGTITKTSGSGFQLNSSISLNNSPIISSTTATTASIFVSTVTGVTIGSSTIRTTQFPADGTTTTGTASGGYMGMPQVSTASTRALVATDAGKHIYVTATGQSIQIPAEGTTNFPVGTTIVIINAPSVSTSITITTDTLRLANSASTGTRTLASNGMCTLVKIATGPGVWIASGNGLT